MGAGASAYTHKELPNSAEHVTVDSGADWSDAYGVATSNHGGGVNVVYGDVHTGFIDDQVDPELWRAQGTAAGAEPTLLKT